MKAKAKIYFEYGIREQIAAGGSDDWQIRLGKYIVSLQYMDCPGDGFLGRLASLAGRVPQRLVAVVYQRNRDGQINAIRQISVPAKGASITTDNATVLKLFGHDGQLCGFEVSQSKGPYFLGGKWGRISASQPIRSDEQRRGITRDTERWISMK
ncbi:hypothetical protein [Alistipes shahii]|uniref:hypothetical protein n=1 Tax=Alistipes shahii TaxID=328814 RepID=UPI002676441D|nr:hypothetical protein [Alistipes shahii]